MTHYSRITAAFPIVTFLVLVISPPAAAQSSLHTTRVPQARHISVGPSARKANESRVRVRASYPLGHPAATTDASGQVNDQPSGVLWD
jgi:hypothetical protein